jgi:putative transcriptional regulator
MPRKSKILDAVYQTAKDFHEVGVMPTTTMRRLEKRCLPQVHPLEPEEIKRIREKEHVSQAVFSAYLNTSLSTVQKWEIGEKMPSGAALKLLNLVAKKGLNVLL